MLIFFLSFVTYFFCLMCFPYLYSKYAMFSRTKSGFRHQITFRVVVSWGYTLLKMFNPCVAHFSKVITPTDNNCGFYFSKTSPNVTVFSRHFDLFFPDFDMCEHIYTRIVVGCAYNFSEMFNSCVDRFLVSYSHNRHELRILFFENTPPKPVKTGVFDRHQKSNFKILSFASIFS